MNGAITTGSIFGFSDSLIERSGGGTFADKDFVKSSSGEAVVGTAGASILGVSNEDATSASTGVQINNTLGLTVVMDNDNSSDTFVVTDIGLYGDFIGATGAMQVDTSSLSTTKAQLLTLEYNPQGYSLDSDTSIGRFLVVETEMSDQAAA